MTRPSWLAICCVALTTLVACGGDGAVTVTRPDAGESIHPVITSFTASPAELPLGGGEVTLSWQVSNATELSIDNGIGKVSGTSTTVRVTSSTRFTLTATRAAESVAASASVAVPTTMTVSGKVVDIYGVPLPNAAVAILGGQSTSTDSAGAFSLQVKALPYDIVAVASGSQEATLYKGLTRSQVTLILFGVQTPDQSAVITGIVRGGETPYSPDLNAPQVLFASPETRGVAKVSVGSTAAEYVATVSWTGPSATTGTLYAVQPVRTTPGGVPTRYAGFSRRDNVTLGDGSTISGYDLQLGSVGNSTLGGSITIPAGYSLSSKYGLIAFEPGALLGLFLDQTANTSFSYPIPNVPQATFSVFVCAENRSGAMACGIRSRLQAGDSDVRVAMQDAPHPNLPIDLASNVTRANDFTWTTYGGGIYVFRMWKDPSYGAPYSLVVVTRETRTTLPDLGAIGMALPGGARFGWWVDGVAPFSSVDEAVDGPRLGRLITLQADGTWASSEMRVFTTAPSP